MNPFHVCSSRSPALMIMHLFAGRRDHPACPAVCSAHWHCLQNLNEPAGWCEHGSFLLTNKLAKRAKLQMLPLQTAAVTLSGSDLHLHCSTSSGPELLKCNQSKCAYVRQNKSINLPIIPAGGTAEPHSNEVGCEPEA